METGLVKNQTISMINMKVLTMNGVMDIAAFDEGYILLETTLGGISIEGENLKIESLTADGGDILIKGDIKGIYATGKEKRNGFMKRLFG